MFSISQSLVRRFLSQSGIIVAKDLVWILGVTVYMIIYARMGKGVIASINIFDTIRKLAVVFIAGVGNACMIMDTIAVWFIGLPLALLAAFVWKLSVEWVFALISTQEIFKLLLSLIRFFSKKWIHNLVQDIEPIAKLNLKEK